MTSPGHPEPAWKRLGRLLAERRVQINPEYRNRLKFAANVGLNERLVSDLERGRRTRYRETSLQAVEIAYQLQPGSVLRTVDGGELEPREPVVQDEMAAELASVKAELAEQRGLLEEILRRLPEPGSS